ncbi:MAG: hypothetical protein K0S08_904 [Gammaproteobacteria bacterium]|jgi:hypothetical protein|nr:hypothetical protein [Gammaproteobacteria bacterium]
MPSLTNSVQQTKLEEELKADLFKGIAESKLLLINAQRLRALIDNPYHTVSEDQVDDLLEHLDHNKLLTYFKLIEDRSNIYQQLIKRKTQLEAAVTKLLDLCNDKIAKLEAQEKPSIPSVKAPSTKRDSFCTIGYTSFKQVSGSLLPDTYISLDTEIKAEALAKCAAQTQRLRETYETTRQEKLSYFKELQANLIDKPGEARKNLRQKVSAFANKLKCAPETLNTHRDITDDSFFAKAASILRSVKSVLNDAFSLFTHEKTTLFKCRTDSVVVTEKMQEVVQEVIPVKPQR